MSVQAGRANGRDGFMIIQNNIADGVGAVFVHDDDVPALIQSLVEQPSEPSLGSEVVDKDGDHWGRLHDGWQAVSPRYVKHQRISWDRLNELYGPLKPITW